MGRVLVIAPIYNYYPILLHALELQSHGDWQLLLIHDGPNRTGLKALLKRIADPRVRYCETPVRFDDWGHSLRAFMLDEIKREQVPGDYIVITNADNYYVPTFLEYTLRAFSPGIVAVYCSMVHNHYDWTLIDTALVRKKIDCGCLVVTREAALSVGWRSRLYHADWIYVEDLVCRFGASRFQKIENVLFVHN